MQDHHHTALQAVSDHAFKYLRPSTFRVTHRLADVRGLQGLAYDLFILDRDCTLHGYHATNRVPKFNSTLRELGAKSEIVSNSSYNELLRIRDIFGDMMPVSKLVTFAGQDQPHLLRFTNGTLNVLAIDGTDVYDITGEMSDGDTLYEKIERNFKKPNPAIIHAVIAANKAAGRVSTDPRVLMVGDRYLTDIAAGNLAGADTALVNPHEPLTDKLDLIALRYLLDSPFGAIMSRL